MKSKTVGLIFCLCGVLGLGSCNDSDREPGESDGAGSGGADSTAGTESGGRSGGGNAGAGTGNAAGQAGGEQAAGTSGLPALDPPTNVDLRLCETARTDDETCNHCCVDGGFSSSAIVDDQCACGTPVEDNTTCSKVDALVCVGCCADAGFASSSYSFDDPGQCVCMNKVDSEICAPTQRATDPEPACQICCLNNGFLVSSYAREGNGECTCSF